MATRRWNEFLKSLVHVGSRPPGRGAVRVDQRTAEGTDAGEAGRRLVVCVHGYVFDKEVCESFWDFARPLFPGCDFLFPRYPAGLFANTDPYLVASEIRDRIEEAGERYSRIVLVGCSSGALLVRKALLLARRPRDDSGSSLRVDDWVQKVERVVLFAGLSRGWSFAERPRNMAWPFWVWNRFATKIARLPFWANFIMALERGAPFVADLRVEWIRAGQAADPECRLPPIVQVLGDTDDFIRDVDNRDVLITADSIHIPVKDTGHLELLDFRGLEGARRQQVEDALTSDLEELRQRFPRPSGLTAKRGTNAGDDARAVVFIMHGIRDNSDWCRQVQEKIQRLAPGFQCETSSYGNFSIGLFLLFPFRQKNVRWFMDRYTEALARNPGATTHFVGHSNGTYLMAAALDRYESVTMDRIAFVSTVVPSRFPWHEYEGRVRAVRNDRAASDWIVGWGPAFFERIPSRFADLGQGGFRGFDRARPWIYENYYLPGGHGAGVRGQNLDSLARFVVDGEEKTTVPLQAEPSGLIQLVSNVCWLVWLIGGALVALPGAWLFLSLGWWALGVWVGLVLLILLTV